jgi:hypothetical protein
MTLRPHWLLLPAALSACADAPAPTRDAADVTPPDAAPDVPRPTGAFTGVVTLGVGQRSATCEAAAMCAAGAVAADRETTCGSITQGGVTFPLPAPLAMGSPAVNVYDTCNGRGDVPDHASRLVTQVIDTDGEVVTAHLFADNYFELYVNGRYVARDSLGFTPFNTAAVRFQARYPMTIAVRLVDWEGYLGVGLESRMGAFHIGDGGFIAAFSNGAATGATWRCRSEYIAPLDDTSCLVEDADGNVDSSRCPSTDATVRCLANSPERTCRAAHAPLPADWASPAYDASRWTPAALYDAARVTADPAYASYAAALFAGARFIWTRNLDLDNHVVCRVTLTRP